MKLICPIFFSLLSSALSYGSLPSIEVLTERTPITFRSPNNLGDGQATRLVHAVLADTGLDYELTYIPWKRVYRRGLQQSNVVVFPLARTPNREESFHWLGMITPVHYYLFGLAERDDINVTDLEQAKKLKVGVVNQHAIHQYLLRKKFLHLQEVNSALFNIRKIKINRIDLFSMSSAGLVRRCEQEKIDCKMFKPVVKLNGISNGLYMALSIGSAKEVAEKIERSYLKIVSEGRYDTIMGERANDKDNDRFLSAFSH